MARRTTPPVLKLVAFFFYGDASQNGGSPGCELPSASKKLSLDMLS